MLVTEMCSYCFTRGDHLISAKPLSEDWVIACGNCCNVMTLSNIYITETLTESISYPHNWRHQVHVTVTDAENDTVILYSGEAEQAGSVLSDGVYIVTDDLAQTYSMELRGHSLVDIMPIAQKPGQ